MKKKEINQKGLSRRDFIKGTAAGALGVATMGLLGACSSPTEETVSTSGTEGTTSVSAAGETVPATAKEVPVVSTDDSFDASIAWDAEADIVIIGFGGAGAGAAVEAAREGATVLVLEKSPEELYGGNTSVCVGGMYAVGDPELAKTFLAPQVGASVSDAELDAFIQESMALGEFLESLLTDDVLNHVEMPEGVGGAIYPTLEGAAGLNHMYTLGTGAKLFASLKKTIDETLSDLVTVMPETPATQLIFVPETKEVRGVYAESEGKQIAVKAKKAVIMACGGFENNADMMANYIAPGQNKIWAWGSPYNTGDGIKMVSEVGAELRHLNAIEWGSPAVAKASEEAGVAVCLGSGNWPYDHAVVVNKYGKRFYNELNLGASFSTPAPTHSKENIPMLNYDIKNFEFPNLPHYIVFDEVRRAGGPLCDKARESEPTETWTAIKNILLWSDDNLNEIDKGYILKADSLEELAELAGIDPEGLVESVETWNASCAAGEDSEFGRVEQLTPIDTPPYYIAELAMSVINTDGGATRNEKHQVMSWEGNPIPRLYSAGEFGSIFGFLYCGAMNCPEAVVGGKFAAQYALSEETAWD